MKTEQAVGSIFEALVDIRKKLDEKINLLDEQIRRAQLRCLENAFQQQKEALAECQDGMDQQLITLSLYVGEYQHLHGSLRELNEKILELGGEPPEISETNAGDGLAALLLERLDYLKGQGRI